LENRNVFCLHPHQDRYVVDRTAVTLLPEGMNPGLGVLAANMETAVNGVWDAQPNTNDRVTVIGAGVVGALVAWRMQSFVDAPVELVDVRPDRKALADALGLAFAVPDDAQSNRSIVVHASGSEAGLCRALELADDDGRIIEMSWYGDRKVSVPLGEDFHSRRLTIQCSQVGAIPPHMRETHGFSDRMAVVLDLLCSHPELGVFINSESAFEIFLELMPRLALGASEVLCHRVCYPEEPPCTD
jgi:threonine dehydrogenase-like Zn-dependent dehydrogenase